MTKAAKLNKLVDDLSVCNSAREGVRLLVAELSGEKLQPEPEKVFKRGQKFQCDVYGFGNTYIIGAVKVNKVIAINLQTGYSACGIVNVKDYERITPQEMKNLLGSDDFTLLA